VSAAEDVARMLTLVPWLLERPGASVDEVVEAFGVPERTIRGDLAALDFCGLPGLRGGDLFEVSIVGDRVVVRMADELRRPLRLTPREALRLVLTLDSVEEGFGDVLPALGTALGKIREAAGVPEGVRVELERTGAAWIAPLRDAIAADRAVRLAYRGRNDDAPRERQVDPWALHVTDGTWYLQGHDASAAARRTFRLDRVADVSVLDEARTSSAPAGDLPPPRYEPGEDDVEVVLRIGPAARWLLDDLDASEVLPEDDVVRATVHTDAPRWLERLVLMAGGDATVVAPPSLASAVRDAARQALARYDGASGVSSPRT
jgi:proteasome accessory factor C